MTRSDCREYNDVVHTNLHSERLSGIDTADSKTITTDPTSESRVRVKFVEGAVAHTMPVVTHSCLLPSSQSKHHRFGIVSEKFWKTIVMASTRIEIPSPWIAAISRTIPHDSALYHTRNTPHGHGTTLRSARTCAQCDTTRLSAASKTVPESWLQSRSLCQ